MSLYQVRKLLFHVNRDPQVRARFLDERERLVPDYELTVDERRAILEMDFHALYDQPVPAWSTGCAVAALEPR